MAATIPEQHYYTLTLPVIATVSILFLFIICRYSVYRFNCFTSKPDWLLFDEGMHCIILCIIMYIESKDRFQKKQILLIVCQMTHTVYINLYYSFLLVLFNYQIFQKSGLFFEKANKFWFYFKIK